MKKIILIALSFLFIAAVSVWFSCNSPFNNKQNTTVITNFDTLNGTDIVRATVPVQPDIYIPAALITFRNNMTNAGAPYVIVESVSDTANNANYKVSSTYPAYKYTNGQFEYLSFEVNATETEVNFFKETTYLHYFSCYPDGQVLYDGLYKYLKDKNGTAPSITDPLVKMSKISVYSSGNFADGSRLIVLYTDSSYWTIYRKAGSAEVYYVQGQLSSVPQ